ncbi:MAG: hypothetical protein QM541_13995, partial [Flavobacterium sp.]|nr:hypothetical protein [Flavobacterium sp.]
WTKAELDAYDYVLMREQDHRGRLTKIQKDFARKLIKRGRDNSEIAEDTGLTIEKIEKLRAENTLAHNK